MAARLVYQPVAILEGGGRVPLSSTLVDPGQEPTLSEDDDGNPIWIQHPYVHSSAMSDGGQGEPGPVRNNCLSLVAGVNMINLDADSRVVTLFETDTDQPLDDIHAWLDNTPTGVGWNNARINTLRNKINAFGGDSTGLTGSTPLWRWVNAAGRVFSPTWDIRESTTSLLGA